MEVRTRTLSIDIVMTFTEDCEEQTIAALTKLKDDLIMVFGLPSIYKKDLVIRPEKVTKFEFSEIQHRTLLGNEESKHE